MYAFFVSVSAPYSILEPVNSCEMSSYARLSAVEWLWPTSRLGQHQGPDTALFTEFEKKVLPKRKDAGLFL